jgi:Sodium / potassium ATPase beta chain
VKIGVFYVIYYAFLAGFFMGMLLIFYQTLDEKVVLRFFLNAVAEPVKITVLIQF